jgi:hypothetical protein
MKLLRSFGLVLVDFRLYGNFLQRKNVKIHIELKSLLLETPYDKLKLNRMYDGAKIGWKKWNMIDQQ